MDSLASPALEYLADFMAAVRVQAQHDADKVAAALPHLAVDSPSAQSNRWPAEFLLGLGIAARLADWENNNIDLHEEAGLPEAMEVAQTTLRLGEGPELAALVRDWSARLMSAMAYVGWAPQLTSQVSVRMVVADDDAFLEQMADFLWDHRHTLAPTQGGA